MNEALDLTRLLPAVDVSSLTPEQRAALAGLDVTRIVGRPGVPLRQVRWIPGDIRIEAGAALQDVIFGRSDADAHDPITVVGGSLTIGDPSTNRSPGTVVRLERGLRLGRTVFLGDVVLRNVAVLSGLDAQRAWFQAGLSIDHVRSLDTVSLLAATVSGAFRVNCLTIDPRDVADSNTVSFLGLQLVRFGGVVELECGVAHNARHDPEVITFSGAVFNGSVVRIQDLRLQGLHFDRAASAATTAEIRISGTEISRLLALNGANFPSRFVMTSGVRVRCGTFVRSRLGTLEVDNTTTVVGNAATRGHLGLYGTQIDGRLVFYQFQHGSLTVRSSRIGGSANFHASQFDTLVLDHSRFGDGITSGSAQIGRSPAERTGETEISTMPITLSLEAATGVGRIDFDSVRLFGRANLSFFDYTAGSLLATWEGMGQFVTSVVGDDASPIPCDALDAIPSGASSVDAEDGSLVFARFEQNARQLNRLLESTEAFFYSRYYSRTQSTIWLWVWGYGVRPLYSMCWLVSLFVLTAACLTVMPVRILPRLGDHENSEWPVWLRLPVRRRRAFIEMARSDDRPRISEAMMVALVIVTGRSWTDSTLVLESPRRFALAWAAIFIVRLLSFVLFALTAVAFARTFPLVREVLDTALKI